MGNNLEEEPDWYGPLLYTRKFEKKRWKNRLSSRSFSFLSFFLLLTFLHVFRSEILRFMAVYPVMELEHLLVVRVDAESCSAVPQGSQDVANVLVEGRPQV